MNIQELKLFRHLAASLHFGRTSRACNLTPSALTRTIQRLEEELGQRLFIRDNRSVALTPAGQLFREYAEDALQRWQELVNRLAAGEVPGGQLTLYCSVTAVYGILPRLLGRFREEYPRVHLNLQTGDAARALLKLRNEEAEVVIAALPDSIPPGLEFLTIIETPLVFIGPARFPGAVIQAGEEIDWRRTPLIMAERGLSRERLDRWLAERKIEPNIYAQVAGNEAIIAMVSLGCGVGVVPRLVLENSPLKKQIRILEVTPELTPFSVGVCTPARNLANPIIRAFWTIAEREKNSGAEVEVA
jgi:LysR family positive regulator for ilvC